jgi:hypothetical protein
MPSEQPRGPHNEGRQSGSPDFSGLTEVLVLARYDGTDLEFLADGPKIGPPESRTGPRHDGVWLVTWREGGKLSAGPNTPLALAGVPRWLAIPLSEQRKAQVLAGEVSLREIIVFSEWHPYVMIGPDPLHPDSVERVAIASLPRGYIPTQDVSVKGERLHVPYTDENPLTEVFVHLVPDGNSSATPSLSDSGAIQEALSRYLSWTAHMFRRRGEPLTEQALRASFDLPEEWTRLTLLRASPGTLRIDARIAAKEEGERRAINEALSELKRASESASASPHLGDERDIYAPVVQVALFGLMDLLRQLHICLTVKWGTAAGEDAILIGSSAAQSCADRISVELGAALGPGAAGGTRVKVPVTDRDLADLNKDVDPAAGGFQKLIWDIRQQLVTEDGRNFLELRPDQVEKVVRYVQGYGAGGAQDRLRPVYNALYRLGISFVGIR